MKFDMFHVGSTVQSRRVKESVTPRRIFPNCLLVLVFLGLVFRLTEVDAEKKHF